MGGPQADLHGAQTSCPKSAPSKNIKCPWAMDARTEP